MRMRLRLGLGQRQIQTTTAHSRRNERAIKRYIQPCSCIPHRERWGSRMGHAAWDWDWEWGKRMGQGEMGTQMEKGQNACVLAEAIELDCSA